MSSAIAMREKQHAQRRADAAPEEREHADREGDVGRGRNRPAVPRGLARERQVDQGGGEDAARRRHERQGRLRRRRERAVVDLAADLKADHEEEDGHQDFVDEEVQRELPGQARRIPERCKRPMHAGIREGERRAGGGEQHQAARRLDAQELLERLQEARDRSHDASAARTRAMPANRAAIESATDART